MAKKVLIIEDDMDVAKILALRFKAAGFEIAHVVDGMNAIREAQQFKPDIIILDMMLPAGGGWGVLKNLRLSIYTSLTPVIVYTGMEDEARKKEMEAMGVEAYFQKPYDPVKIVEKAQEILK